jgi:hypothetical protein
LAAVGVTVRGTGGNSTVSATTDAQGQAKLKLHSGDFSPGPCDLTLTVDNDPKATAAVTVIKMSPALRILPPFGHTVTAVKGDQMEVQVTDPQTGEALNGVNIIGHKAPLPNGNFGQLDINVEGSSWHPGDADAGGIVDVKLTGSTTLNPGYYNVWFTVDGDPTASSQKAAVTVELVKP